MNTIVLDTDHKTMQIIIEYLNSLKVRYEVQENLPYNDAFIQKMDQSIADEKAGRLRSVSLDEVWK